MQSNGVSGESVAHRSHRKILHVGRESLTIEGADVGFDRDRGLVQTCGNGTECRARRMRSRRPGIVICGVYEGSIGPQRVCRCGKVLPVIDRCCRT